MDEATWSEMLDINLSGVFRSVRAVTPHRMERGTGSIVITSSINGLEPAQNYVHYVPAKHGLIGLMKNVALELAPYGVRANAISPGAIDTPMTDHQTAYDMFAGHEAAPGRSATRAPTGSTRSRARASALKGAGFLPAQAIADTLYLNSDLAAAVTGVVIPVDAGHMVLPGMNPAPAR